MKISSLSVKNYLKDKILYFIVFSLPVLIMYLVYVFFSVYPAGDNSVLVLDLNGQYVYYYEALRDAFWGKSSLIYSWSRNLSGEFMGINAYYLASPFSLIPVLLPRSIILTSLKIMQLAKIGAAAVTFAVFTRNYRENKNVTIILFSIAYSLMGYSVVELMNPMWIDGLIYLPLIVMGIEMLVKTNRMSLLIISLSLMFIANFYIGYMLGLFSLLYYVYFSILYNYKFSFKDILGKTTKFICSAVVSVMIAMIVLLPVYKSLQLGKLEFSQPDYSLKLQFKVVDFLSKLLPFSYDTVRPEGLPFIYTSTLTVLLVPLYLTNTRISQKKKILNTSLLFIIFLCMYLSTADIVLHGFQVPNWLPFRYSFVFSFVLILMAMETLNNTKGIKLKNIVLVLFGIIVFLIYLEDRSTEHIDVITTILPTLLFTVTYSAILSCKVKKSSPVFSLSLIIMMLGEQYLCAYDTVKKINKDVVYSKYSSYQQFIEDGRDTVSILNDKDSSLYRSEKTFFRTVNDNMAFGLKGVSHSSSTLNTSSINFLNSMGYTASSNFSKYTGNTKVSDSLLGIKYVLSKTSEDNYYDYFFTYKNTAVYKNKDALSIAYMVNNHIMSMKYDQYNPFENQNQLLNLMSGNENDAFVRVWPDDVNYENISVSQAEDHICFTPTVEGYEANINYKFTAQKDGIMYMYFPSLYEREMTVIINNKKTLYYYENENYCIVNAGSFKKGEKIEVKLSPLKECIYMFDQYFYILDQDVFEKSVSKLAQNQLNVTYHTDTDIRGTINADDNGILFTSIPYEEGWKIYIDGKRVQTTKLIDTFLGAKIQDGQHEVRLLFRPDYLYISAAISFAGVLLLIVIIFYERKRKGVIYPMDEKRYFVVKKIDGDYAVLERTDKECDDFLIARELLPFDIDEGSKLLWHDLCYEII